MSKIKVGDLILIKGLNYFEKCEVITVDKSTGISTLNNGIKFVTKTLEGINTKYELCLYDEDEYEYLKALRDVPRNLVKLSKMISYSKLSKEELLNASRRLSKIFKYLKHHE